MNENSMDEKLNTTHHPEMKEFIENYVMENGSYKQSEILNAYNKMRSGISQSGGSKSSVSRKMHELSDNYGGYVNYFTELIAKGKRNNKHRLVDKGLVGYYPDVKLTLLHANEFMAGQVETGIQKNCSDSVSFVLTNKDYVLVASQDDEAKKKLCDYLDERLRKRSSDI